MKNEVTISVACFVFIFIMIAVWELLMPRRVLTTSKTIRWVGNLSIGNCRKFCRLGDWFLVLCLRCGINEGQNLQGLDTTSSQISPDWVDRSGQDTLSNPFFWCSLQFKIWHHIIMFDNKLMILRYQFWFVMRPGWTLRQAVFNLWSQAIY